MHVVHRAGFAQARGQRTHRCRQCICPAGLQASAETSSTGGQSTPTQLQQHKKEGAPSSGTSAQVCVSAPIPPNVGRVARTPRVIDRGARPSRRPGLASSPPASPKRTGELMSPTGPVCAGVHVRPLCTLATSTGMATASDAAATASSTMARGGSPRQRRRRNVDGGGRRRVAAGVGVPRRSLWPMAAATGGSQTDGQTRWRPLWRRDGRGGLADGRAGRGRRPGGQSRAPDDSVGRVGGRPPCMMLYGPHGRRGGAVGRIARVPAPPPPKRRRIPPLARDGRSTRPEPVGAPRSTVAAAAQGRPAARNSGRPQRPQATARRAAAARRGGSSASARRAGREMWEVGKRTPPPASARPLCRQSHGGTRTNGICGGQRAQRRRGRRRSKDGIPLERPRPAARLTAPPPRSRQRRASLGARSGGGADAAPMTRIRTGGDDEDALRGATPPPTLCCNGDGCTKSGSHRPPSHRHGRAARAEWRRRAPSRVRLDSVRSTAKRGVRLD